MPWPFEQPIHVCASSARTESESNRNSLRRQVKLELDSNKIFTPLAIQTCSANTDHAFAYLRPAWAIILLDYFWNWCFFLLTENMYEPMCNSLIYVCSWVGWSSCNFKHQINNMISKYGSLELDKLETFLNIH